MTYKEMYMLRHPGVTPEEMDAIIIAHCPQHYGDMEGETPNYCDDDRPTDEVCPMCWNREVPGTEFTEPHIKDSGERRQFGTGAVRDIQEGKGRCDLMPLDVVAKIMTPTDCLHDPDLIVGNIALFKDKGDTFYLYQALSYFAKQHLDTIPNMLLEVAKHFEDGAKKYGENNWQKGIPVRCYIDSAVRHYLKYQRGDKDEPHDRAFCWNILCAIWTCNHKPELNEYAHKTCPVCNSVFLKSEGACPHCRVHVTDSDWDMADYEEENE